MNKTLLQQSEPQIGDVMVVRVEEAEMDEMWSFVQSKQHQRWLWQDKRPSNRQSFSVSAGNA